MLKKVKYTRIRKKSCAIEIHDNHIRIIPLDKAGGLVNYILNGLDSITEEQMDSEGCRKDEQGVSNEKWIEY